MSDCSNQTNSLTASSSTSSLVVLSESTSSDSVYSSIDAISQNSPYTPTNDAQSVNGELFGAPTTSESPTSDVDPQILEALKSKDRIYVLRLGEILEDQINEKRCVLDSELTIKRG